MHGRTPSRFTPAQAGRRQPERARPGSLEHRPLHGVEAHHVEPTGRVRPRDARTHADAADRRDDPPVATGERLQQVAFTRMLPPDDRVLLLGDAGRWIVAVVFRPAPTAAGADSAAAIGRRRRRRGTGGDLGERPGRSPRTSVPVAAAASGVGRGGAGVLGTARRARRPASRRGAVLGGTAERRSRWSGVSAVTVPTAGAVHESATDRSRAGGWPSGRRHHHRNDRKEPGPSGMSQK